RRLSLRETIPDIADNPAPPRVGIGCRDSHPATRTSEVADMRGISRRRLLAYGAGVGAAVALPWPALSRLASASAGRRLEKFVQALPVLGNGLVVATPSGANQYSFTQVPITRQLHPKLPRSPAQLPGLDPGRPAADPVRPRRQAEHPPARRLRQRRQRR